MLNTPSNLYSGAAQVVNTAPHIQFQIRLLQQKQAKEEALDSYYRKLPLTINDKGVRDQDRPSIASKFMELKQNYLSNKEKIKKGDQAAIYNYEQGIRSLQDLVGKSQSAGLTDVQVGKLKFNPTMGYVFQDKNIIDRVSAHHLPVDDPNHVDLDLEELTIPNKPFDRVNYFKGIGTLKGNENIKRTPNGDGTVTLTNTPTYEQPQKDYVLSFAADKYLHDASFKDMVDKDLGVADASNPFNADFKENFGHDIQTPIDLATAYTFNGLKPQPVTQKIATDQLDMLNRRQKFAIAQQARGFGYAKLLAGIRNDMKNASADEISNAADEFIDVQKDNATPVKGLFGSALTGDKRANVSPQILQLFDMKNDKGQSVYPDNLYFLGDGGIKVQGNGIDKTFTRSELKAIYVNKFFNTKVKRGTAPVATPKKEIEVKGKTGKKIFIPGQ